MKNYYLIFIFNSIKSGSNKKLAAYYYFHFCTKYYSFCTNYELIPCFCQRDGVMNIWTIQFLPNAIQFLPSCFLGEVLFPGEFLIRYSDQSYLYNEPGLSRELRNRPYYLPL